MYYLIYIYIYIYESEIKLLSDGVVYIRMVAANIVACWSYCKFWRTVNKYILEVYSCRLMKGYAVSCVSHANVYTQGPPKKCIHTLTKENSTLYNRLL